MHGEPLSFSWLCMQLLASAAELRHPNTDQLQSLATYLDQLPAPKCCLRPTSYSRGTQ